MDIFGENAVVASSAAWVEKFRTTIEAVLKHTVRCKHVCWRPSLEMLKEEGIESENVQNHSSITFGTLDTVEVITLFTSAKWSIGQFGLLFYESPTLESIFIMAECMDKKSRV